MAWPLDAGAMSSERSWNGRCQFFLGKNGGLGGSKDVDLKLSRKFWHILGSKPKTFQEKR